MRVLAARHVRGGGLAKRVEAQRELAGGGVLVLGAVLAKILGARKGSRGSVTSLEERGALDENRYVDDDKFFSGMMKTVRTVEMPELTSDQIKAARERRRQSRDVDASPSSLDNVELPANHPFATTAKVSESERKKLAEIGRAHV